jgi:deoxyribodipyrimidine photolyase
MSRQRQEQTGVIVGKSYPERVVDHAAARLRTLRRYTIDGEAAQAARD